MARIIVSIMFVVLIELSFLKIKKVNNNTDKDKIKAHKTL